MKIRKRNGSEVTFNKHNIVEAITRANSMIRLEDRLSVGEIKDIAKQIEDKCKQSTVAIQTDDIQNFVEKAIMAAGKYDVATAYIVYRYQKALDAKKNTIDDRVLSLLSGDNEDIQQENANKNPNILSTMRDYMAGEVSKDLSQRYLLPADIYKAHKDGIIHFHDMDYFAMPEHNCFGANEELITDTGIRKFCSFSKNGESTYVKDKDGKFRLATVKCYGMQSCNKVTLTTRTGFKKEVIVTPNHRWILQDGTVTTNLKVGDVLALTPDSTAYNITTRDEARAWCIGFIVGDGCDHYAHTQARLCGYKNQYVKYFEMAGFLGTTNETGDCVPYTKFFSKQDFINGKAWRYMSVEQKALVFNGYYAADGNQDRNSICTTDDRIAEMIEELSGIAGYYIMHRTENVNSTNYKDNVRYINFKFLTKTIDKYGWKVANIESYQNGKEKQVWCVEEPITHSFTLANGVVTGNCCLINLDDMLQNGTVISGNTIDKPHTFKTACNIASQIIAQVASSQYGGQTITVSHLSKFVPETREYFKQKYPTLSAEQIEDLVKDDIEGGVQTLQYQILTLQTTNGQTPFVSVCLYLNEAENEEAKEDLARVIEEILKQRIKGVKNESGQYYANPFPKLLYFLEEDNITPDSKYWYLTKLAATCTTKRMVPDYISEKIMKQQKISKKGEEGDAYPCMGCVSGDSVVRIKDDNETKFITMEELWINYAKNIKHQFTEDNPNLYTLVDNLKIFDNKLGDYTTCKMINKNINNNWVLLKLKSDTEKCEIKCTDNHIWTTIEGIDKTAKELSLNDKLYYSISDKELIEMNIESIIYIQDDKPSYDVTTETEHFEVNGLYSHNCRSFLTPYRQPKHDETLTFTEDVDLEIES